MRALGIAIAIGISFLLLSLLYDRVLMPLRARRKVQRLLKSKTKLDPRALERPEYGSAERQWVCPWCGSEAQNKTTIIILDSRACDCGAVGIAAPRVDSDEIIDEAIDYFHVTTRPESCGFDDMFLQDIQRSGIEIREGALTRKPGAPEFWATIRHLWFRRHKADGNAG